METIKEKKTIKTTDMVLCAMFASLIAVGAFIRIPIPYVPFTLQLFFTTLAGLLLGPKLGAASSLVYMITGLIGIPIFTEGGGPGYIFKPSFGYIIGFVIGSFVTGMIASKAARPSFKRLLTASLAGLVIVYAIGMIYCFLITNFYLGTDMSVKTVFLYCFLFIIPGDLALTFLASFLSQRLIPILNREREKK